MSEIAGTFNGKCFERGISTMRLALGYKQGLPSFWLMPDPPIDYKLLDLLSPAFPEHYIRVWHPDKGMFKNFRDCHWEYMGADYKTSEESDNWLIAFAYAHKDEKRAHFVIGEPVLYDDGLRISLVVAVALDRNYEGADLFALFEGQEVE